MGSKEKLPIKLLWEDPPPRNRVADWTALLAALQQQPGNWALLWTYEYLTTARSMVTKLRKKYQEYEFSHGGVGKVYGRYIGKGKKS
jgi:hypothetical protein